MKLDVAEAQLARILTGKEPVCELGNAEQLAVAGFQDGEVIDVDKDLHPLHLAGLKVFPDCRRDK